MKIENFEIDNLKETVDEFMRKTIEFYGDNLIFIGIPSGDYEEECFAVPENIYREITNDNVDVDYLSTNPFHKDMVNLYMYEILNNKDFIKNPLLIGHLTIALNDSGCKEDIIVISR